MKTLRTSWGTWKIRKLFWLLTKLEWENQRFLLTSLWSWRKTTVIIASKRSKEMKMKSMNSKVILTDSSGENHGKSFSKSEEKIDKESEKFPEIHSFVSHHLAKNCSEFERQLFSELFEQGKVILLLDGLDEISPFCDKKFNRFLLQLESSPVIQV